MGRQAGFAILALDYRYYFVSDKAQLSEIENVLYLQLRGSAQLCYGHKWRGAGGELGTTIPR